MSRGLQIVEDLRFLCPTHPGQGLEFDNYGVIAEEVDTVAGIELLALVIDRQINFPPMGQTARGQLQCQCFLIDGLEEPATQLPVYLHRRPDNLKSPRIPLHHPQITQITQIRQAAKTQSVEKNQRLGRCTDGSQRSTRVPDPHRHGPRGTSTGFQLVLVFVNLCNLRNLWIFIVTQSKAPAFSCG